MARSSKSGGGKTGRKSRKSAPVDRLAGALESWIDESLLPGDTPFEAGRARDAADFLLEAARQRQPGRAALKLESVTGETRRFIRIAIVNEDMPFLVDSLAAAIDAQGLAIDRLVHPVIPVTRTAKGKLTAIEAGSLKDCAADPDCATESMIYIETARADAKERRALETALRTTLGDVRAAVSDWPKVQARMLEDAHGVADKEGSELLRWLNDGMLTQLGHVTRHRDGSQTGALGVCRKSAAALLADASFDLAFAWFDGEEVPSDDEQQGRTPLIIKSNLVSNVHRRVPLDLFIVPMREDGEVVALSVHTGVWTSAGLATPPREVPRLRVQLSDLTERFGFDAGGHAGKSLEHALTVLPHDLLVGFSDADIARVATTMMGLVDRPRPRLAIVEAPLARHLFAFVWLPRDMLATQVRLQIQGLLESIDGAKMLDWSLMVEGGNLAMLRFVLDYRDGDGFPDAAALEARLQTMLRGWREAVEGELAELEDPGRAAAIAARFADAFPQGYRTAYGPAEAARDIRRMRRLTAHEGEEGSGSTDAEDGTGAVAGAEGVDRGRRDARLYRLASDEPGCLRLKIYQHRGTLPLSDVVPALENFGFHVLDATPTELGGEELGTIHDFLLSHPSRSDGNETRSADALLDRSDAIEQAIVAVLNGHAEDDPFNRLVIGTGLAAREADWLRAFYRYLRQAGMGFTIYTVVDALDRAPDVTRALVSGFTQAHDPDWDGDRAQAAKDTAAAVRRGLVKVRAINDDRLLRLYQSTMQAVLRTNAFAPAAREALALKLDSENVPGLPRPVPWREIFVYSRRVEGIHLRAGPVARGGLRWSDRRDDFRTEILGLMKAQRVKNAVIVPTGAKGGFYPKQLPPPAKDRDAWAAEGQASYEVFIRSLLSVTDNIVREKVVHPDRVVCHDGDDPYFVVAADKGTARFSDIANAIATGRDFWLDDAFASGGSNGYDHKAMGITARGAWVSVQRHFLEQGVDVQADPVSVAGCGDMSGDVFGNGMLLSKSIRLVAAFDHRHIFIDPDPDAAAGWKERKRLFDLPRSSWEDYDPKLISRGGGVFSREEKRIKLTAPMRRVLGVDAKELDPPALIAAILKAPVDLLWFGGIGTYIKAEAENNATVGDPANDDLRVDAREVRARVIGEGANLGVTQAGRIAYAQGGGRINTDFIDNAAGVNCSDNEVNIKIALAGARRAGRLSEERRNALLEDMTDEVAELVLEDNRLQALALSIAEAGGARAAAAQSRLIETLEDRGYLDRRTEGLVDTDVLARRAADGLGLTRPELAVLLSSTKLVLQDAAEASAVPDDPAMEEALLGYFPQAMQGPFGKYIREHRLRREIVATMLANRIVNRLGLVHPFELAEEEGATLGQICAAFVAAERLFAMGPLWETLDTAAMPESARLAMFGSAAKAMRSQMADLLRAGAGDALPSETVAALGKPIAVLADATDTLLGSETRAQTDKLRGQFEETGAPGAIADRVAHLFDMDGAVGLAKLSGDADIAPRDLTEGFTWLGARLGLDWAQGTAAMMNPSDVWERLLVAGLARDFQQMRLQFLRRLSRRKGAKRDPQGAVESWAATHADAIRQFRAMIDRAQAATPVAPAMLAQIASQARNLLAR